MLHQAIFPYGKRRSRGVSLPWHLKMVLLCTEDLNFLIAWFLKYYDQSFIIPRNFIKDDCFISYSFRFKAGDRRSKVSPSWGL